MTRVLTCTNQKGGVAKTTTNWALAGALRSKGLTTLLVDLDPQCNLTSTVTSWGMRHERTVKDVFDGTGAIRDSIVHTGSQGDVLPSTLALASADMSYTSVGRERMLERALREIDGFYDYVLIDTPPSLGILTLNSLSAANYAIIPMMADAFSFQALEQLCSTIRAVREYSNPGLEVLGIVVTNYTGRANFDKRNLEEIRSAAEGIGLHVFETVIRNGVKVREAQEANESLYDYAPTSLQAAEYMALSNEIEEAIGNGEEE